MRKDITRLNKLVNGITEKMKKKFISQSKLGYDGWDDHSRIPDVALQNKLLANVRRGDWVDVANLAAILQYRQEKRKD